MCFGGGGSSAPYPYQPTTQEQADARYRENEARYKAIRAEQAAGGVPADASTVTIEDKTEQSDTLGSSRVTS